MLTQEQVTNLDQEVIAFFQMLETVKTKPDADVLWNGRVRFKQVIMETLFLAGFPLACEICIGLYEGFLPNLAGQSQFPVFTAGLKRAKEALRHLSKDYMAEDPCYDDFPGSSQFSDGLRYLQFALYHYIHSDVYGSSGWAEELTDCLGYFANAHSDLSLAQKALKLWRPPGKRSRSQEVRTAYQHPVYLEGNRMAFALIVRTLRDSMREKACP